VPGQPAARAGLRPGDVIVRVDQDSIRSWSDMLRKIWSAAGRPLRLTVLRDGRTMEIVVTPEPQVETDTTSPRPKTYGVIGAQQDPPITRTRIGFGRALAVGADQTVTQAAAVVVSVKKLLFRQASIEEVGGPILIAQMSGQAARLGLDWFLGFMAFFSVSLAVLNLLPIPVLDGGQAVFLIAEAVRRKPLSLELRQRLTQIGLVVILGLMLLGIANDLLRVLPVKDALESYVAGRVKPERLVIAISAAYYGDSTNGNRESLQPLIDVIDRASPGIVELGTATSGPGFDIRLAERPFPKQYEAQLREAAEVVLSGGGMRDAGYVKAVETTHPASRISHF